MIAAYRVNTLSKWLSCQDMMGMFYAFDGNGSGFTNLLPVALNEAVVYYYILRAVCVKAFPLPFFSNGRYPFLSAPQSDNLLSYLTVEETLTFTAQLALRQHSATAIRKKVSFPLSPPISVSWILGL